MKSILTLILSTIIILKATAEIDCEKIKDQLAYAIAPTTTQNSLNELATIPHRLIILGERHYSHYFWKLPHIYKFLKSINSNINCLYSEISADATDEQIKQVIAGKTNAVFFSKQRLGFGPLYESILSQGDNLVFVDEHIDNFEPRENESDTDWLFRRDTKMLNRITESFKNNECTGGIYNIGNAHIHNFDVAYNSFGARIKKQIPDSIVIEQAYTLVGTTECELEIPSFLVSAKDQAARKYFGLDDSGSTADYILYLRTIDTMFALLP